MKNAEKKLVDSGVFKGYNDLRDFAECDEFWKNQPYGKRLYYDGGRYLHLDVLRAAIKILDNGEI